MDSNNKTNHPNNRAKYKISNKTNINLIIIINNNNNFKTNFNQIITRH